MKKILLLVMLATSLIFLNACGSARNPMISDPDGNYLTAKEGSYTYTVKNGRVYEVLKGQVGYSILKDLIDTDLLKNTTKDGKSYWDQVTQESIDERLEEDIFPTGKEDLTEEEIAERREKHLDRLFSEYGLITENDVFNYYRLLLAKENYALDQVRAQVAEKDFTESEYTTFFNNHYKDEYYAIIVSFDSDRSLDNALKQLGYQFKNNKLAFLEGAELNNDQVVRMFIDLYNMLNANKVEDYPNASLFLNEGVHYKLENGKVVFDLDKIDSLHYTHREITSYESGIQKLLATFDNYNAGDNFYTKTPQRYKNGSRSSMFMKIDQVSFDFDTVRAEIKEDLIKQKLTNYFINTQMAKLREKHNIEIYDRDLALSYKEEVEPMEIEFNNKNKHKTLVAKTDLKEYSADDLFSAMNRNYGISSAISEIEFNRFVDNLEINNIYDFNKKEVLDATRWEVIQQAIKDEKANFKKDMYAENGYPASMGWDTFIKEVYGVNNERDLERYFVFQDVRDKYSKSFGALEGLDSTSEKWQFYLGHMEKMVEDYFNVTGVHLLITINDANGNPVDPAKWTENQIELAKEFYNQVMDYINNEEITETADKKIKNVQNAFNRAPYFVPGIPQETASQPEIEGLNYEFNGIEVSKFKTAGLTALFQDLGSFTNGTMVEEFNDAAKSIWDANSDSSEIVVYGSNKDNEGNYEYLVTQFGYHIYVNTKTTPIEEYSTGKVLPLVANAIEYIKDNNSSNLSTKLKNSLNTYFKPIYSELTSTNYLQIVSYKAIKGLDITLNHDDYTVSEFTKFLELTIETKEANLKFK